MRKIVALSLIAAASLANSFGGDPCRPTKPAEPIRHTDTPKPLTKRQRRRLRGKATNGVQTDDR